MSIEIISTPNAPGAIGPYSQAVATSATSRLVFCSGQIPLDPRTGEVVAPGDIRAQTERVMENLFAVLVAAGGSFSSVVKTTIFLVDLRDFAIVNEVYATRFPTNPPARATVQVAALPRGVSVEIDAIAAIP